MQDEVAMSSTHRDSQGERYTLDDLQAMEAQANGDRKVPLTVAHDITLPPVGKTVSARIVRDPDGGYVLLGTRAFFDKPSEVHLLDGTVGWQRECRADAHPFHIHRYQGYPDLTILGVHRFSFQNSQQYQRFVNTIVEAAELPLALDPTARKAAVPDAELLIRLGQHFADIWLLKQVVDKIVDKAGDKLSDEIATDAARLYAFLRAAIIEYARYIVPVTRPKTYVLEAGDSPIIQFVVKTPNVDLAMKALQPANRLEAISDAEQYQRDYGAEKVQFKLDRQGKWRFQYLVTSKGTVIGKPHAIAQSIHKLKVLQAGPHGMSVGGSAPSNVEPPEVDAQFEVGEPKSASDETTSST